MSKRYVKLKCEECDNFTFWDGIASISSTLVILNPTLSASTNCRNCNARIDVLHLMDKLMEFTGKNKEEIDEQWWKWIKSQGYEVIIDK